jgi:signal transduction histidine kinase
MDYDTVVKKHGGEIRILDSELGGASFRICLPLMQGGGARELNDAVT